MRQAPDRKKLRREYLRRKSVGTATAILNAVFFVPCLIMTIACLVVTIGRIVIYIKEAPDGVLPVSILSAVLTAIFARCTYSCWKGVEDGIASAQLPYVPPATPATLPADEILVRSSEEPPVSQSKVLLRAAKQQEIAPEELLRMNQGEQI
jgi:hypothetical protein